jgi:alpha-N-arabinofuranosidase
MAKVVINTDFKQKKNRISRNIYGHFAEHLGRCIYEGFWVGKDSSIPNTRGIRKDVVKALRKINIPNLRWPGGCFADEYHWKDGIGQIKNRPKMVNTHWGGVIESNHFGTHEFFDLCHQLGCEPYICGNVGSGTVQEMSQWIEYITFDGDSPMVNLRRNNGQEAPWKIKYWGVGNENWGCGGNMTAEYYSDLFLQYSTYCRDFSGNKLYKIACGPAGEFPINQVLHWVDVLMKKVKTTLTNVIQGMSLHYYTRAGMSALATKINEKSWLLTMKKALYINDLILKIGEVMNKYDPSKRIKLIVDEWGTWWRVEKGTNPGFLYQQNTMRDAIVASLHLDIFNNHCDRVYMANIAQIVNVLQAMILTQDEKIVLTPTYHVFDMYKIHQDAMLLPIKIESEIYGNNLAAIHGSASINDDNEIHISLCNINPNKHIETSIKLLLLDLKDRTLSARILKADQMNAHNTFESPHDLKPENFNSSDFIILRDEIKFKMPKMAIIVIKVSLK